MNTIKSEAIFNTIIEKIEDPKNINLKKKIDNGYTTINIVIPYLDKCKLEGDDYKDIEIGDQTVSCTIFDDFEEGENTTALNTIYKSFIHKIVDDPNHKADCRVWYKVV